MAITGKRHGCHFKKIIYGYMSQWVLIFYVKKPQLKNFKFSTADVTEAVEKVLELPNSVFYSNIAFFETSIYPPSGNEFGKCCWLRV